MKRHIKHIVSKKNIAKIEFIQRIKSLLINLKVILTTYNSSYFRIYKDSKNSLEIKNYLGKNGSIDIGQYTYGLINLQAYSNMFNISIGSYTSISEITMLIGGNHHNDVTTFPFKALFMQYSVETDNFPLKESI